MKIDAVHATLVLLFAAISPPVQAQDNVGIPRFDIESFCYNYASSIAVSPSIGLYENCFSFQQIYYDRLKSVWPLMSEQSRSACNRKAQENGLLNYWSLYSCVRWADENLDRFDMREFKY